MVAWNSTHNTLTILLLWPKITLLFILSLYIDTIGSFSGMDIFILIISCTYNSCFWQLELYLVYALFSPYYAKGYADIPYETKFWRENILANLANYKRFAKNFLSKIFYFNKVTMQRIFPVLIMTTASIVNIQLSAWSRISAAKSFLPHTSTTEFHVSLV